MSSTARTPNRCARGCRRSPVCDPRWVVHAGARGARPAARRLSRAQRHSPHRARRPRPSRAGRPLAGRRRIAALVVPADPGEEQHGEEGTEEPDPNPGQNHHERARCHDSSTAQAADGTDPSPRDQETFGPGLTPQSGVNADYKVAPLTETRSAEPAAAATWSCLTTDRRRPPVGLGGRRTRACRSHHADSTPRSGVIPRRAQVRARFSRESWRAPPGSARLAPCTFTSRRQGGSRPWPWRSPHGSGRGSPPARSPPRLRASCAWASSRPGRLRRPCC